METHVVMPSLGETMTDGTVNTWYHSVGESVVAGEPLLEIGTDKVDSEVVAPASGILTRIVVEVDGTAPVGAVLATISST